jgi:hypothetical protein
MQKAARERAYWHNNRLNKTKIMNELGVDSASRQTYTKIWKLLKSKGLVEAELFVEVILKYGLGIANPHAFIANLVNSTQKQSKFLREINEQCLEQNILRINYATLYDYINR